MSTALTKAVVKGLGLIDGHPFQRHPRRSLGDVSRRDDGLFELLAKFLVQCVHTPTFCVC